MAISSEEVLLQLNNVKYKKDEGTLYVTNTRIAFITKNSDTVALSHSYTEIKTQKISSDTKIKVQLQLVFHDGSSTIFQFMKPEREDAMKDRNAVKDMLVKMLAKAQGKASRELDEKKKLLMENELLRQLYNDLVVSDPQIVSAREFWEQYAPKFIPPSNNNQSTGIPGHFMTTVKPQADGCNSVKFNLTPEIILCIFKTYPVVGRKHTEYVPHKMSEEEFWKKFFESHYFQKDRTTYSSADIFSSCVKFDEIELKRQIDSLKSDDELNLTSIVDGGDDESYKVLSEEIMPNTNSARENIIKRFNQYSMRVLKASAGKTDGANNKPDKGNLSTSNSTANTCSDFDKPEVDCKKIRLASKITYEDLMDSEEKYDEDSNSSLLKLNRVEEQMDSLVKLKNDAPKKDKLLKANDIRSGILNEVRAWSEHGVSLPIDPATTVRTLSELTPGGKLMRKEAEKTQSLNLTLPQPVEQELANLYRALGELLRHFWDCFPPTTPQLEEKAQKMNDSLVKFRDIKLKAFQEKLSQTHTDLTHVTSHLVSMLNSAFAKFATWNSRKRHL